MLLTSRIFCRRLAIAEAYLFSQLGSGKEGEITETALGAAMDRQRQTAIAAYERRIANLALLVEAEAVESGDLFASYGRTAAGVAVIPVSGVLAREYDPLSALCGFQSYEAIQRVAETAAADQAIRAGLLAVNSPGGEWSGCRDCGDAIARAFAAAGKPLWAISDAECCSAAYALVAPAERIFTTRDADLGSIGVIALHRDVSAADKAEGIVYTPIFSGARKIDGWSHRPLAQEALKSIQARVDQARAEFAAHVGAWRAGAGLDAAAALATDAAVLCGSDAVAAGLADAVSPFDQALAELTALVSTPSHPSPRGVPMPTQTTAAPAASPQASSTCAECGRQVCDGQDGEQAKATRAARAAALRTEGAAAERARIAAILDGEDGRKRPAAACQVAFKTDMTAEAAAAFLAGLPAESAGDSAGLLAGRDAAGNPVVTPGSGVVATDAQAIEAAWDRVHAQIGARRTR